MAQEIIPDKQSVLSCLKQKVYYVDFYQREYVWTKNTVEVLLNDIFYAFEISYKEHKDEEMSQEVLEKYNWYYLNVFITNKVEGKVFIVDGQQRLSTLTLIATKLYHITKNDNLRDILRDCIYAKDQFKGNVFCIDNDKRKNVMQCILDGSEYQDAYKNKTEETIIERYEDISRFIDDRQLDDVKLTAFIYYFLNRLVLVELSIQKDDTPMVFEVINDRGEALKPFEILKGKMIGLLSKSDTNKYSEKWDAALNRISGREDNFFADYLKSQFVFKKNASLEKQIINSYHRYIFDYNDIANKLSFRRADKKHHENIKLFINNELDYYTSLYAKISTCGDEFVQYNLNINDISGLYQQIMAACDVNDELTDEKIHAIAKEADRLWVLFITRRDIIQPLQQEQATQQVTLILKLLYILKIPPVFFIFREDMLYMVSRLITGFSRNIVDIILHILIRMLTDKLLNPREQITQESAVRIRIVFSQEAIEIQQRNLSRNITLFPNTLHDDFVIYLTIGSHIQPLQFPIQSIRNILKIVAIIDTIQHKEHPESICLFSYSMNLLVR
jgi:uncharacterized protein with ParB-like and HNH nuclease domain